MAIRVRTTFSMTGQHTLKTKALIFGLDQASFDIPNTAKVFSDTASSNAPIDTGRLKSVFAIWDGRVTAASRDVWGVAAPMERLEDSPAVSRGTISEFRSDTGARFINKLEWPQGAWWGLSPSAQKMLLAGRLAGKYGGRKPYYWRYLHARRVPTQSRGVFRGDDFLNMAFKAAKTTRESWEHKIGRSL